MITSQKQVVWFYPMPNIIEVKILIPMKITRKNYKIRRVEPFPQVTKSAKNLKKNMIFQGFWRFLQGFWRKIKTAGFLEEKWSWKVLCRFYEKSKFLLRFTTDILKENVHLVPNTCNLHKIFCKGFLLIFFFPWNASWLVSWETKFTKVIDIFWYNVSF